MATENYLASEEWLRSQMAQQPSTGLLATTPTMTPYQRAMAQMQQSPTQLTSLLSTSGGYKPGIFGQRSSAGLLNQLSGITDIRSGGVRNAAEQARIDAFFDAMTPAELAEFQAKNAEILNMLFTPTIFKVLKDLVTPEKPAEMSPATYTPPAQIVNAMGGMGAYNPSIFSTPVVAPESIVVTPLAPAPAPAPAAVSSGDGGGGRGVGTGGGGRGVGTATGGGSGGSTGGSTGAVSSAVSGGTLSGTMGIGTSSLGGVGSGGSAASGGGGGGAGGSCCFIMLEARYGNGTMDRVVRRYRDEKITDRNKRGYYKLAEVFVPLMRKSKLFSFIVVKTFADPAVCYAKWYYGENKWGWIFKPLEKFWMSLFDTLGSDTKFIRENGETV